MEKEGKRSWGKVRETPRQNKLLKGEEKQKVEEGTDIRKTWARLYRYFVNCIKILNFDYRKVFKPKRQ